MLLRQSSFGENEDMEAYMEADALYEFSGIVQASARSIPPSACAYFLGATGGQLVKVL